MMRKEKNAIMIFIAIVLIITSILTVINFKNNEGSTMTTQINSSIGGNSDSTVPSLPDSSTDSDSSSDSTVPDIPDSSNDYNTSGGTTSAPDDLDSAMAVDPQESSTSTSTSTSTRSIYYYIILGGQNLVLSVIIIYLILSKMNKKSFNQTLKDWDKKVIALLSICLITDCLTIGETFAYDHIIGGTTTSSTENDDSTSTEGSVTIDDVQELSGTYSSTTSDESVILVENGGNATITDSTITKSGDSSDTENSEFYGVNAAILVTESSTATISDTEITTDATGANAVFATGTDAKIYISDSTITSNGESSARGLDATYGGYIEADNVTITTSGGSCATLATDRGEGTVIATNSTLTTNGTGSPIIYSTGSITLEDSTGTANASQMVCIEGKNSATVTNVTLTCAATPNREDVDQAGVMIYQSMSGDADEGTGTFSATDSNLSIMESSDYYQSAPFFFVTNTDAIINLENTTLSYGSGKLLKIEGTSEWGTEGSNGGNVEFNATNQTLEGDIEVDNISTLTLNLASSTYEGTINNANTASSITLTIDSDSTLSLTGDSYVTSLTNNGTINTNGYNLYVNGELYTG